MSALDRDQHGQVPATGAVPTRITPVDQVLRPRHPDPAGWNRIEDLEAKLARINALCDLLDGHDEDGNVTTYGTVNTYLIRAVLRGDA